MALPRLCSLGLAALFAATTFPLAQASAAQQWPEDGRGQGLFTAEWHEGRRQALMETFLEKANDKDGVIVLRVLAIRTTTASFAKTTTSGTSLASPRRMRCMSACPRPAKNSYCFRW
jgi:hypothetical protein